MPILREPPNPSTLLRAALSGLLACAQAACTPGYDACFDPAAVVRSPQVLAVRADPPEVVYEPGDPTPTVRLRALVALTDPHTVPMQVTLRLCSPNLASRCDDALAPAASSLVDSDNVDLQGVRVPPEVIAQALRDDPLHGYGGIRVLADLSLQGLLASGVSLRAGKVLLFSPHGTVVNQAIEVDQLWVGGPARSAVVLSQGESVNVSLRDQAVPAEQRPDVLWLTPLLRPGSVEEYDTLDNVSYQFRASSHFYFGDPVRLEINGGFGSWSEVAGGDVASEPLAGAAAPASGLAHLRSLKASPNGRAWVVARDTRGAEAWLWFNVGSQDTRCCSPEGACDGTSPNGCPVMQEPLCDFADSQRGTAPTN
jgi:hypothetical protein